MNTDDIIKFRKTCEKLLENKKITKKDISKEIGLSEPSVIKIMTVPLSDLKGLRASTLAAMQDFSKKHKIEADYADITPEDISADPPLSIKEQVKQRMQEKKETERESSHERKEATTKREKAAIFWNLVLEASMVIPENVEMEIKVKH